MSEVAALRRRARDAYEHGRLRIASRVGWVVVPIALLCMWETRAPLRTALLAAAVFALATMIRWRQVAGFKIVRTGFQSGAVPLAAALGLCRFAPECPPSLALALCGSGGLMAGALFGRTLDAERNALTTWLSVATVGGLLATMGCLALGVGTALGAVSGIAVGAAITTLAARRVPA